MNWRGLPVATRRGLPVEIRLYGPVLLALGVRADTVDCDGKTALHHAITMGRATLHGSDSPKEAVPKLLEQGADPDARDNDGHTPLQLAVELHFSKRRSPACDEPERLVGGGQTFAPAEPDEPQSSRDAVAVYLALGGELEAPPGGSMPDPLR